MNLDEILPLFELLKNTNKDQSQKKEDNTKEHSNDSKQNNQMILKIISNHVEQKKSKEIYTLIKILEFRNIIDEYEQKENNIDTKQLLKDIEPYVNNKTMSFLKTYDDMNAMIELFKILK